MTADASVAPTAPRIHPTVHSPDVDAGARITPEPYDTDYGSRDCTALDPGGNRWQFGAYRPGAGVG